MASENEKPTPPRTTIQVALRDTLRDTLTGTDNAKQLAARASIPEATLSEFRNNRRSINVSTMESLLDALTPYQYSYFLSKLVSGFTLLQGESGQLGQPATELSREDFRQAFFGLIASYCHQCSQKEQIELLAIIHEASTQNPKLTG